MCKIKYLILLLIIFCFTFASCSSAPKNPGDVFTLRRQAEDGLKNANREAARGNLEVALSLLTGFKRNAVLADDQSLIIRISLSMGNVLFSLDRRQEAFAEWDLAISEAVSFGNKELLSVSKIFKARGNLLSDETRAASILEEVNRESANIRSNRLFIAFSWQVRALALRSLKRWQEAENASRQSLNIHEKDRHLENASFDWYTIASIRSLADNTNGAIEALESSIAIDRRIENSSGLAAGYRAMGDVYRRAGREEYALEAYKRAISILEALGNDQEIAFLNRRINRN